LWDRPREERAERAKGFTDMNRFTVIAVIAAAVAITGCKKKEEGNKPAATDKPVTGPAAPGAEMPAAGSMAAPGAGSMAAPGAGSMAAGSMDPATGGTVGSAAPTDPAMGAPPAGPAPTDAEFEAMMGKAVVMFTAMGAAADKSGGDCGKLAESLDKVMTDNQDFIGMAKKYKGNPETDKKGEEWMKAHQDQVMGPMMKVAGAGQKCSTDAKFQAVMAKLGALGN